jgi:hypothetical protein
MGYAPYTNDCYTKGQGRVLGEFREACYGHIFEYAARGTDFFPEDFQTDLPHVIFVGDDHQARLGHVKKTVATILCDEDDLQKWSIKGHREYAK